MLLPIKDNVPPALPQMNIAPPKAKLSAVIELYEMFVFVIVRVISSLFRDNAPPVTLHWFSLSASFFAIMILFVMLEFSIVVFNSPELIENAPPPTFAVMIPFDITLIWFESTFTPYKFTIALPPFSKHTAPPRASTFIEDSVSDSTYTFRSILLFIMFPLSNKDISPESPLLYIAPPCTDMRI